MGVIQRQATKSSLINWAGVFLGIINILFVAPLVLEVYGIYTFINSVTMLAAPVITIGMTFGSIKFFNEYNDGSRSNRTVFSLGLVITLAGFLVVCLLSYIFRDQLISFYQQREPDKYQYLIFVYPLTLFGGIISVLVQYTSNFKRIVIPTIARQAIKVVLPVLLFMHWKGWLDVWQFLYGIVAYNVLVIGLLLFYLRSLGELDFRWNPSFLAPERRKEMRAYLLNGMLLSLGSVIAGLIDSVMVGSMIDIGTTTAIYSIGTVMSNILLMPNSSVASIAGPIISQHWANNDMKSMQVLYNKAGLNLLIVGLLLFSGMWASIDDVFKIMKNGDIISAAKYVLLFLGLARLFSMACGVNGNIIYLSPKYRVGTFSVLFLAGLNVLTNYIFIKQYGMVGAAIGTALSVLLYNAFVSGYLFFKYRIHPFHRNMVWAIVLAVGFTWTALQIEIANPFVAILIKSFFIFVGYSACVFLLRLSPDINDLAAKVLRRVGIRIGG